LHFGALVLSIAFLPNNATLVLLSNSTLLIFNGSNVTSLYVPEHGRLKVVGGVAYLPNSTYVLIVGNNTIKKIKAPIEANVAFETPHGLVACSYKCYVGDKALRFWVADAVPKGKFLYAVGLIFVRKIDMKMAKVVRQTWINEYASSVAVCGNEVFVLSRRGVYAFDEDLRLVAARMLRPNSPEAFVVTPDCRVFLGHGPYLYELGPNLNVIKVYKLRRPPTRWPGTRGSCLLAHLRTFSYSDLRADTSFQQNSLLGSLSWETKGLFPSKSST
jgi:hypothetical protein